MKTLSTEFYVILSGRKGRYMWRELKAERIVKRTTGIPALGKDEIPIRVNVTVPVALFERPELTVSIEVDGPLPRAEINAETMTDLAARVQELVGVPVHVKCDVPVDYTTQCDGCAHRGQESGESRWCVKFHNAPTGVCRERTVSGE